jgi:hypothetical protein
MLMQSRADVCASTVLDASGQTSSSSCEGRGGSGVDDDTLSQSSDSVAREMALRRCLRPIMREVVAKAKAEEVEEGGGDEEVREEEDIWRSASDDDLRKEG